MRALATRPTRITLVEDDASLLGALTFALEADGYQVAAYAAARHLLENPPEADCLVIDLKLPDMDGLSLIKRLRALGPQPPAILITTNPDDRVRRAAEAVQVPIVEKPLMGGELRRRIASAIGEASD
jgi:DNA-binding response OmpR family regulator